MFLHGGFIHLGFNMFMLWSFGNQIEEFVYKYKYQGFEYEVEEVTRCLKSEKKESVLLPLQESLDTLIVIDQLKINQPINNL